MMMIIIIIVIILIITTTIMMMMMIMIKQYQSNIRRYRITRSLITFFIKYSNFFVFLLSLQLSFLDCKYQVIV